MSTISHDYVSAPLVDTDLPRVGYDNLFRGAASVVSVSSADANHPKEMAFDGLTYDGWLTIGNPTEWIRVQTATLPADYMAIAAHSLVGCTLTPQSSPDGVTWTNLDTPYVATDNRPIVWEWIQVAANYFRLLIENATVPVSIGAIHVGVRTEMQKGLPNSWAPPDLNEVVEYTNVMSQGGQILGRQLVRRGATTEVTSDAVTFTWAKADWLAFIEVAHTYPVFFWWSFEGKAEVMFGGIEKSSAQFMQETKVRTQFTISGINR